VLACENGTPERPTRSIALAAPRTPAEPAATPAAASAQRPPRVVRFDGGEARIEAEFLSEHIDITLDGREGPECWCAGPVATYDRISAFFERLQAAVATDDRRAVTSMMKFPLRVNRRKLRELASAEELLKRWDRVFDERAKRKIASANPRVVCCRDGTSTMLGPGVVWAGVVDGELRVQALNR
jgi:hypothetical protein